MISKYCRFLSQKAEKVSKPNLTQRIAPFSNYEVKPYANGKIIYSDIESFTTRFAICFGGGSRNESHHTIGASHFLAHYLFGITSRHDIVAATRPMISGGVKIKILNDRDNFIVSGSCGPNQLNQVIKRISDAFSKRLFRYDEFKYARDSCMIDYDNIHENSPETVILDHVHEFAFRKGYGNSLFMNPIVVDKLNYEKMDEFFGRFLYMPFSVSVCGFTNDFSHSFKIFGSKDDSPVDPQEYSLATISKEHSFISGEVRLPITRRTTYVAIAFQGPKKYSPEYYNYLVMQKYMVNSSAKSHLTLGNAVLNKEFSEKLTPIDYCKIDGFTYAYNDNGLFGFIIAAPNQNANMATSVTFEAIKKVIAEPLDKQRFENARMLAKLEFLTHFEEKETYMVDMAKQIWLNGTYTPPEKLVSEFDTINPESFEKFMKEKLSARPVLGVIGDPYLVDSLDDFMQ